MATSCSVSISGTSTGATCISYSNCDLACCTKTPTGCGGTVSAGCETHGNPETCNGNPCCFWAGPPAPPPPCKAKACADIAQGNCAGCGCTPSGTCVKIACGSLTGTSKNPDVCPGCDTCAGTWTVDTTRNLPWGVFVTTKVAFASGQINLGGYRLTAPVIGGPGAILGPGEVYY